MKYLFVILVFCAQLAKSQTFSYPQLNKQGKDIEGLIPSRWKAIDTATGDLNNDKIADLAIIYEYNLPIIESRAYVSKQGLEPH
ncbi:MAG: hypothetical protein EOO91_15615 [Pedobacter sp.]|nr:MAG: hypothetical protein EOO91_15615 [Pedobacter sp.]